MRLYDTRAKSVVDIVPASPGVLRVYACGPTVYRDAHIGNMRTFMLTDLIARVASFEHLDVRLVQNITDVGHMTDDTGLDKMLVQSDRESRGALDIAQHYESLFHEDLARLNIYPADAYPRASESIDLMIELIGRLIELGHAYIGADGSVFFDARSFESYGALSGNRLEDLRPGHRFEGGTDPAKRFHADWALWKKAPSTRTQLVWDTPWGVGFPGWHTECSAMSVSLLGETIDIHTGGIDLRFPHHEDERAQSNAFVGHEVVRHWVHGEHLLFEGRKMSKSTGNVVLVQDVIERGFDPLALRLTFLEHRYRQQMNVTWEAIEAAHATLRRWRDRVAEWATSPSKPAPQGLVDEIIAACSDDLDTAGALQILRQVERDATISDGAKFELFAHVDRIFGLDLTRNVGRTITVPDEVFAILEQRAQARADRDWATSDLLRDGLAALGWIVTDTGDGQSISLA